jgi:hypothetical protein
MLRALVKRGADLWLTDNAGRSVAHEAARNGHLAVLQLLHQKGAALGARSSAGRTPLEDARAEAVRCAAARGWWLGCLAAAHASGERLNMHSGLWRAGL